MWAGWAAGALFLCGGWWMADDGRLGDGCRFATTLQEGS